MPSGGGELANRFLAAFNTIDRQLSDISGDDGRLTFKRQVYLASRKNVYVKKYAEDLLQFADLRNAIVHTRKANTVIAEPHEEVVQTIERIMRLITDPPIVADVMTLRPRCVERSASLGHVLQMFRKYDVSRCPVVSNGEIHGLITVKCIVKWLESVAEESLSQHGGEKVSVEEAMAVAVESLLGFSSDNEYRIVGRQASVADAVELFQQGISAGRYVQALLVTVNGKSTSPLVGIVTPSDLPRCVESEIKKD